MRPNLYICFILALISFSLTAQRKEIGKAEQLMDEGEYYLAKKEIDKVTPATVQTKSKSLQARYYRAVGMIYLGLNAGELSNPKELKKAITSFKEIEKLGKHAKAKEGMDAVKEVLLSQVMNFEKKEKYDNAYHNALLLYELQPRDTLYLYYAANHAFYAEMDAEATELFTKLKEMDFKGNKMVYSVVDKATGIRRDFLSKNERDAYLRFGEFEKPSSRRLEPLNGEVLRKLAILYYDAGKDSEAENLFKTARKQHPNDFKIVQAEAGYYQAIGAFDKYEKTYKDLIESDRENAPAYYMILANDAVEKEDYTEARTYYGEALALDSSFGPAYRGMALMIVKEGEEEVNQEIHNLKEEEKTPEKIEEVQEKRKVIYNKALPYLEKSYEYDEENLQLLEMLYKIHFQLGNKEKAEHYRKIAAKLSKSL